MATKTSPYWKQGNRWNSIYFTKAEKYGKTTVTFKEHSSRKQNHTSHDQSEFTKLKYVAKPTGQTAQNRNFPSQRKSDPAGCPTSQVQVPFSFLKSHDPRCHFFVAVFLSSLVGERRQESVREDKT